MSTKTATQTNDVAVKIAMMQMRPSIRMPKTFQMMALTKIAMALILRKTVIKTVMDFRHLFAAVMTVTTSMPQCMSVP